MTSSGRVAAIDLGERHVGVAVSDEGRRLARPLGIVPCVGPRRDAAAIRSLLDGLEVELLVVGLPVWPSDEEGPAAEAARERGRDLARRLELPLVFVDEAYSTDEARRRVRGGRRRHRNAAGRVDDEAAVVILEAFLAAAAPGSPDG